MTETPNPHIVDSDTLTGEMRPIRRAVLSLGSNLGRAADQPPGRRARPRRHPRRLGHRRLARLRDRAGRLPAGSEDFLNAVVLIDTTLAASRLLDRAHAIEDAFGRERGDGIEVNAPRTLDVDVIVVGDRRADDDSLRLPAPARPRARVRAPALVRRRARRRAARPRAGRRAARAHRSQRPEAARGRHAPGPVTPTPAARTTGMIDPPPDEEPDDPRAPRAGSSRPRPGC